MAPSKIKLKVEHKKHEKQNADSGAKLGKSKSKQKLDQQQNPQKNQDKKPQKLNKSKSKQKEKKEKNQKQKQKKGKDKQKKQKSSKLEKSKSKDKKLKGDKKDKKQKKYKKSQNKSESQSQQTQNKSFPRKSGGGQLQTISNINRQSQRAKLTIGQLIELYKEVSYEIFINKGHNPGKEKQIEQQIQRLQKQKEKRKKQIQEAKMKAQQRERCKIELKEAKKKQKLQRVKQKRRQSISVKLQSIQEQARKRAQEMQKFKQYCTQRKKSFVPRYKKYQQQYKQFEEQIQDQYSEKLEERRQKYVPLNYEELNHFEEEYRQQQAQALEHSQRKLQLQRQIIQQQNKWMKKLYKGTSHKNIYKQIQTNSYMKSKLTAKDKLEKTKQYGKLIKSQFIENKNPEEEDEQKSNTNQYNNEDFIYREKYEHGKCLGLVAQKRIKPMIPEEKSKLGLHYLEYIRKLPRKINSSSLPKTIGASDSRMQKKNGKTYILRRPKNPYYTVQRSETAFNSKNHKQVELAIEQVKFKDISTSLQEKSLHYLQYSDVTDMQAKHTRVNRKLVGDINQKLDLLKKLYE